MQIQAQVHIDESYSHCINIQVNAFIPHREFSVTTDQYVHILDNVLQPILQCKYLGLKSTPDMPKVIGADAQAYLQLLTFLSQLGLKL